jgi:hypothetical protein
VESEVGRGTSFMVSLPVMESSARIVGIGVGVQPPSEASHEPEPAAPQAD